MTRHDHEEDMVRRLYSFMMVTLDGFYEGPDQEFDFWTTDEEFNRFAAAQLHDSDVLLFGRVTYEGMASYWPTQGAREDDPVIAELMNSMPKIVVSTTLESAEWNNTALVGANVAEELSKLKQQLGKDLAILGSPNLTVRLIGMGLVDELRVMVSPVVIGDGKSLFRSIDHRLRLRLLQTRTFSSGNVLLTYQPQP
jgi:dihydrofolate reductase